MPGSSGRCMEDPTQQVQTISCKISSWELWPVVQLHVFKANCQCDDHDIHLAAAMQ